MPKGLILTGEDWAIMPETYFRVFLLTILKRSTFYSLLLPKNPCLSRKAIFSGYPLPEFGAADFLPLGEACGWEEK